MFFAVFSFRLFYWQFCNINTFVAFVIIHFNFGIKHFILKTYLWQGSLNLTHFLSLITCFIIWVLIIRAIQMESNCSYHQDLPVCLITCVSIHTTTNALRNKFYNNSVSHRNTIIQFVLQYTHCMMVFLWDA